MPFQAYNKLLLSNPAPRNVSLDGCVLGYQFQIRYPSYRGTFLSCIEDLQFYVDDAAVPAGAVRFSVNGKQFLLAELPELFREPWFVLEPAAVTVLRPGGLAAGDHTLRVYMKHRIPYTGYFGEYMVLEADVSCRLTMA